MSDAIRHDLTLNRVFLSVQEAISAGQRRQWRRRVSNALEQISVYPAMPPQAILVVRHLSDPDPGQLLAGQSRRSLRAWEQAAQRALNDCWRTAGRPAHSSVSSKANSVWFADPAEYLACLSWDIGQGVATDRWWWQTALHPHAHHSWDETLFQLWREEAQWLPAALTLLLSQSRAGMGSLLSRLTANQSTQLLEQIVQGFQCSLPVPRSGEPDSDYRSLLAVLTPHLAPPVQTLMPSLLPETQLLAAVSLTLPRTEQLLKDSPVSKRENDEASVSSLSTQASGPPRVSPAQIPKIVDIQSTPLESLSPPETTDIASEQSPSDRSPLAAPPTDAESVATVETPTLEPPFASTVDATVNAEQGIATAVGGLWYLVNVLIALDWPGQVPAGEPPTTALSPWRQISGLAQALLPDAPLDPVWGLLAELAGEPVADALLSVWRSQVLAPVQSYLAARLEQPEAIADILLEPATLYLTRTHVDVVFTLEQIRLDVRMAGLDRDPGWVPELARVVAFHYE
ncbi:MAG: hypothetical protein QNJ46_04205 [Leptolyngbyaceae cyanobacterium MO_188.B28]|nr:hypothetical protein [Leptolyngbyaceae cyanobacterium MO_188.B28]